jgi:hypothetical protein
MSSPREDSLTGEITGEIEGIAVDIMAWTYLSSESGHYISSMNYFFFNFLDAKTIDTYFDHVTRLLISVLYRGNEFPASNLL